MAIAYHTHTFSVPTADAADLLAGTEGGKVITPDVLGPVTAAGKALLSAANVAAQRAALDLEPGTDVQAYDADLTALAGLDKSDGNFIVGNGTTWVAESGATARTSLGLGSAAVANLLDEDDMASNSATAVPSQQSVKAYVDANLGLVIGTDVQAYSANLDEYAAVNPTAAGLALLDDADASAQRTTLGLAIGTDVQAYDADLSAIAALAKTDGNFIVGNGTTWVAEGGATARASLGLTIGTHVQAYSSNLALWSAESPTGYLTTASAASTYLTQAAAALAYQPLDSDLTAIAALSTTSFGRALLELANAAAGRTALELGAAATRAVATFGEYNSATATRALGNESVWADLTVLTDAATIAVDFNNGYDFGGASNAALALGGNRTLGAPTNVRNGKKGILWFTASGSTRTLTLNAAWVLATGVEVGPYSITTSQTLGVAYVSRGSNVIVTGIVRIG